MKILHVITGLNDGGAEGALYRLCKNDNTNSHFVVSLLSGGKYHSKFKQINISTYSLDLNSAFGIFRSIHNYKKILNNIKPDIIQTWLYHADFFGGVCSYFFGYKTIVWNIRNCNTSRKALSISTRIIVYINSVISNFIPKRIISVSQIAALHHIKIGFNSNKFVNIPNGYEFNETLKQSIDLLELKNKSSFLIGMIARYDPQKDHKNLLKSLAILKEKHLEFNCLLVGTGMCLDNKKLINEIDALKLNDCVNLLGRRDDISNVMKVLDLHILSSFGEAFPNVLVEAMSNKTLCVSTDVGDSSLIINGNGWIVEPESPSKLANAIIDAHKLFLNNRQEWELMRIKAKESVTLRYSIDTILEMYLKLYKELVE
jgi:glycosyltransferase involved in cell wall biosynthesis